MASRAPVRLNGVTLPPAMIAAEAQHHPAKTPAAAYEAAARALIIRTLLLEEAARQEIHAEPALVADGKRETMDEGRIRRLLEANAPIAEPSEDECRAFYEANKARFHSPDLFEASHILFAADPRDKEACANAEANARKVIEELERKPTLFETVARERSDCDSGKNGGRLGQLSEGETVVEFEAVLRTIAEGAIAPEPVRTRYGVHVLRLDARVEGEPLPFSYVRDRIEVHLAERRWRSDVTNYIDRLIANAEIAGVAMAPKPAEARAS